MKPHKHTKITDITDSLDKNQCGIDDYILLYDNINGSNPLNKIKGKGAFEVNQLILMLILDGEITILSNGHEVHLNRNDYICITPDCDIEVKNHTQNFKFLMYIIYHQCIEETLSDLGIGFNLLAFTQVFKHTTCNEEYRKYQSDIYCELKEELTHPPYEHRKLFARSYANLIFINSINLFSQNTLIHNKSKSKQANIYKSFIKLLNENYSSHRDVQYYADCLDITPKYLSSVVSEYSGKNASSWIDEYVTTKAKTLLRDQRFNINDVSKILNFTSQSFFGRYFKRVTGQSPKQYINEQFSSSTNIDTR